MYGHEWGEQYAEKDASEVQIWDEDECIAVLVIDSTGEVWMVANLFGWYSLAPDLSENLYPKVSDFIDALNKVLETV